MFNLFYIGIKSVDKIIPEIEIKKKGGSDE
jgi:hypothetical protein